MAADMSATSSGYSSLADFSANGDIQTLVTIMFVMSVSIMAGMVFNIFLTKRIQKKTQNYSSSNGAWGALAISSFTIAMMATFLPIQLTSSLIGALTVAVSAAVTIGFGILIKKDKKYAWLGNFVMSFTLIIGMAASVIFTNILK